MTLGVLIIFTTYPENLSRVLYQFSQRLVNSHCIIKSILFTKRMDNSFSVTLN